MTETLEKANGKKQRAIESMTRAFEELCLAQDEITDVEGQGSSDIYDEIAEVYLSVSELRDKLIAMKPTGYFE